ncbi:hypothetical protein QVD99_005912 [Batrachochytrium dendrobatidis]|nr:hypothetical protein O5D80_006098 [Batrachochytrium dendrobatidis]KAK5667303.1 hypothetical protein QVD99_005912 [Batrachochytrium dendrobatidis]
MFQTAAYINSRTGSKDLNRFDYLQLLVCEYEASLLYSNLPYSEPERHEKLARLSNFAYDPINHDFLWQLNIVELFLDAIHISSTDPIAREFAAGGLCNICLDPRVAEYLTKTEPLSILCTALQIGTIATIDSVLTTLWYLSQCGYHDRIVSIKSVMDYVETASMLDIDEIKLETRDKHAETRRSVLILVRLCKEDWQSCLKQLNLAQS